jgi:tetratricopeptide (TPR) repeat protein
MSQDDTEEKQERRDFFISYTGSDRQWAEWIAMQLDQAGYSLFIQAWDFRPGSNFLAEMDCAAKSAERMLLVLSPAYLLSDYTFTEWAAGFRHDPKGTHRRLLPVRIQPCEVDGLLGPVVYIDLVQLKEEQARERLLAGVQQGRAKPATVAFPGQTIPHESSIDVAFPGSLPMLWNIPFARNPFFTGREQELAYLHTQLQQSNTFAVGQTQSISGLGGIGKTQIAVEYAYSYRDEYQYVLWARAESVEALTSSFTEIARLLNLPEQDAEAQEITIQAVKGWLRRKRGWLLILDNADLPGLLPAFLPSPVGGHLLITTRAADLSTQIAGVAHSLTIETFSDEQGALFLLHRSGLLAPSARLDQAESRTWQLALAIAHELGGLPLALDQAGAYLTVTGDRLLTYQQIYRQRRAELLKKRSGVEHPEPVATTWNLSFSTVEQQNASAADLLRLCAFLAPDAIPEVIITKGAKELGSLLASVAVDPFLLNEAIEHLRDYSLLARDPQAQILTIHRLVQAVLRDTLPVETQQQWMQRAVHAVDAAYPGPDIANWPALERLLPHMLICATWIEQASLITTEASRLVKQMGAYLDARARYHDAKPLLKQALTICEQRLGTDHLDTAQCLNDLAMLYVNQGRYEEAESLLRRALAICEQRLGTDHPDTIQRCNILAELYRLRGKFEEAEQLLVDAKYAQQLSDDRSHIVNSLNILALLYWDQWKHADAEPLLVCALAIVEPQLGAYPLETAMVCKKPRQGSFTYPGGDAER